MKIGILGSGNVGQALAKAFVAEGHKVSLATRDTAGDKAAELRELEGVEVVDFETAAKGCELAVLCTPWGTAQDALQLAGVDNLNGKIVIDTNNTLDRGESGVSQSTDVDTSGGEMVQHWLPESLVVKCFNSVGATLMYKPDFAETPTMFLAGNDESAKQQVSDIVTSFGWEPHDAGDISHSRQLEALAVLWINNAMSGHPHSAFKLLS